ncbi:MAG: hypothetical protein Q9208_001908 [Pyrenodesmia sp. 3 TL-2023]
MKPLRLQIVVQPRPTPSPSPSASTPSEPIVKWLEICYTDPTIQELCDTLETRFFQRNHVPLNIKILKYGDDLELFPDGRVRDIFSDINDPAVASDKSKCTVKVYRNPPTGAELADPQRFESLPPNSLARPRKRPLPPTFSSAVRDDYHGLVDHGHPLRPFSPVQPYGNDKRQKVEAFSSQPYFNPDRPLDSLEVRNGYYNPLPIPPQRPSPSRHADRTQKRKRESPKVPRANFSTELFQGSDPYGTPVSSRTVPQGLDKPQETETISVPDSPVSGHDLFDHGLSHFPSSYGSVKPKSPELPTIASRSSNIGPASSDMPLPILPPLSNEEHKIGETANTTEPVMSRQAAQIQSPVPQEPANNHSMAKDITGNASKTPSPNSKAIANRPGQLQRPKSAKRSPSKRTRRVINGVRQKTPSVFDPIETSEGSTYEREQLRSAKRSKLTGPPQRTPKSKEMQATTSSRSPGGQFLLPNVHQSNITAAPASKASNDHVPPKSYQEPGASSREGTQSDNVAELGKPPASFNITGRKSDTSDVSEGGPGMEHCGKALESNADKFPSASKQSPEHDVVEQHEDEEQQAKRKAQADFDRIAAIRSEKKSNQVRTKADPAATEDSSVNHEAGHDSEPSVSALFAGLQAPPELSVQERREWNLKHLVPVRDKYLKEWKAESQAWKKQERTAQAEAQRQQKQIRAEKLKAGKKTAQKTDAEDQHATKKQAVADVADTKERRIAEQQVQDKENKIHELKSKVRRAQPAQPAQPAQQVKAAKANLADFPQPTRMKTKQIPQRKVTSSEDMGEERAQKEKETAMEMEMEVNEVSLQGRTQAASACASLKDTSATERPASTIVAEDVEPARTQGVCKSDQSWLSDRSPKAKYNAARQLQLANERLKQTKRKPMVVQIPPAMAKPTSPTPTADTSAPARKVQSRGKDVRKQRNEDQNGVQHRTAIAGTFNDSDALRAAGISTRMPAASTARKDTVTYGKPTKSTQANGIAPGRSQLHGILKAAEAKSSSPAPERSEFIRNRSMTPAFPSSSNRNCVSSVGVKVRVPRRAATVAPESVKTPTRNGLSASTPGPSQRSVSFANKQSSPSQSQNTSANPNTHAFGGKKGMLYRALEESNVKRVEEMNERAKSTSARSTTTANKITKPPTKPKQTKMTQHLDRDPKGKGKAEVGDRLIYLSSSDEAATYYSDDSEGERGGRAGPSSRKKTKPATGPTEADDKTSEKRRMTAGKLANKPQGELLRVESKNSGPQAATSGNAVNISSSSSSSYSDSEVESALGQTDDVALLPRVHVSSSTLAGSSQRSNQKSTTMAKVSSPPDLRLSLVPEPSSTPKNRTHDARMARLSEEQRMSQEAAHQLQREHMEAVRKETVDKALLDTGNSTAPGRGSSSSQRPPKRAATAGYEEISLSKLRQAQVATKAVAVPKPTTSGSEARPNRSKAPVEPSTSGDSDSSSVDTDEDDEIQVTQPQSQESFTPKKNRLGRVFKELWGPSG